MKVQNKLIYNNDHFPIAVFKIIYVITRLRGEAILYISIRRRYRSYSLVAKLLDYLSDLYKILLLII